MRALLRAAPLFVPVLCLLSCSDAGLYALEGRAGGAKDRAAFEGDICVPVAGGDAFPVKALFALQGGAGVETEMVGYATDGLASLTSRFAGPYITFGLVAYHTFATGIQGSFTDASSFQEVLPRYSSYQESGPNSIRSALKLSKSLMSGDMQTACRGAVARTRYVVGLVVRSEDLSCANPGFNEGIDSRCKALRSGATCSESAAAQRLCDAECSKCELTAATGELKALAEQYSAGEVSVQPIYVRGATADPVTRAEVAAIAKASGSEPIETDIAGLPSALSSLNYAPLNNALKLKRFFAFNRNVQVRDGKLMPDSDGDGVSDDDERAMGLDPTQPDTDQDGLMDGIELRMGLDPLKADVISGCNVNLDEDGDRLNSCEERVLGTNPCMGDTDGDGLPDLVEALSHTNPLVPEDLQDSDRDGLTNVQEVESHSDPLSADLDFHRDRGYGYSLKEAPPSVDNRPCYRARVENVSLVPTLERPNPVIPGVRIPAGTNEVYLYLQVGRDNDPRGAGIGSLFIQDFHYSPQDGRTPAGTVRFVPEDFVLGI
ncbi:calcium-binding protein [Corallococcus sp. H22C18031201]|uniref:thrombospondin type 3 repeat-containing protein n=1 Tax=Citreicoccus inhibens TaxID=2849499 RepID=UPI000E70C8F7|nr:thrombospondin type 3 repeat-containing protein [Citreicoccus inhibens]MBU8894454.1 thrombospondin type 3 repeat-containing protein [Citreicoccus inhibens]RJS16610.1 calcium-binding protein [Corallococcus sp. H22C18031201]